jgi:hypothetical protein
VLWRPVGIIAVRAACRLRFVRPRVCVVGVGCRALSCGVALRDVERSTAARRRWLRSAGARWQRRVSRTSYWRLGAREARRVVLDDFGRVLGSAAGTWRRSLA